MNGAVVVVVVCASGQVNALKLLAQVLRVTSALLAQVLRVTSALFKSGTQRTFSQLVVALLLPKHKYVFCQQQRTTTTSELPTSTQ